MQFKYLAKLSDQDAADTVAGLLELVGEALDTGDLTALRQAAFEAQSAAHNPTEPPAPEVDDAPFTPLDGPLSRQRLALISAGGVFVADDHPMGPDGPPQQQALSLISEFLRGAPTLSTIPRDTPSERLTARHPGYDARTAQRDIDTVFPLSHLRDAADEGRVQLVDEHYAFTGATSQPAAQAGRPPLGRAHGGQRGRRRVPGGHLTGVPRVGRTRRESTGSVGIATVSVFVRAFRHRAVQLQVPRVLITRT